MAESTIGGSISLNPKWVRLLSHAVIERGVFQVVVILSILCTLLSLSIAETSYLFLGEPLIPALKSLPLFIPLMVGPPLFALFSIALKNMGEMQIRLKAAHDELEGLAFKDPLTNLMNRRSFTTAAQREISRAARSHSGLVFMMMDLDQFKAINDTFGHAAGDDTLISFADLCRRHFREADLVGRLGGEEFGVMLSSENIPGVRERADSFRAQVENQLVAGKRGDIHLTVSIGISVYDPGADTLEMLISKADDALYEAKRSGRNRVVTYSEVVKN